MRINPFTSAQASSVWDRGSNVRGGRRPPSSVSLGRGRDSWTAADLQNVRGPIVDDRGPMVGRGRGGSKPRNRANRSRDLKSRRFQEFLTSFYR